MSAHEAIDGGYVLLSRRQAEAASKDKPPLYGNLYMCLLTKARYMDGDGIGRGQVLTSLKDLCDALAYHVGRRKVTPDINQIRRALAWLKESKIIDYERHYERHNKTNMNNTKRTLITLINYDTYQDVKSYERHQNTAMTDSANDTNADSHIMNARVSVTNVKNDNNNMVDHHGHIYELQQTMSHLKDQGNTSEVIDAMMKGEVPIPDNATFYQFDPVYQVAKRLCEEYTRITGRKTRKGDIKPIFDVLNEHGYSPQEIIHVIRLEKENPHYKSYPEALTVRNVLNPNYMSRRVQTPFGYYEKNKSSIEEFIGERLA